MNVVIFERKKVFCENEEVLLNIAIDDINKIKNYHNLF